MTDVWVYWEGPTWPHIDLCLATLRRACREAGDRLHLITGKNYGDFIPKGVLHPRWRDVKPLGVRSDCVRAAVLALHGGVYVDADTLAIQSPGRLLGNGTGPHLAYCRWTEKPCRPVVAGYVGATPGSQIAARWLENVNRYLADEFARVQRDGWCLLGEACLTPALDYWVEHGHGIRLKEFPLEWVLPIEIDTEVQRFFQPLEFHDRLHVDTVLFGLNHSWFVSRRPDDFRTREAWSDSPLLIHRLLHHAEENWT